MADIEAPPVYHTSPARVCCKTRQDRPTRQVAGLSVTKAGLSVTKAWPLSLKAWPYSLKAWPYSLQGMALQSPRQGRQARTPRQGRQARTPRQGHHGKDTTTQYPGTPPTRYHYPVPTPSTGTHTQPGTPFSAVLRPVKMTVFWDHVLKPAGLKLVQWHFRALQTWPGRWVMASPAEVTALRGWVMASPAEVTALQWLTLASPAEVTALQWLTLASPAEVTSRPGPSGPTRPAMTSQDRPGPSGPTRPVRHGKQWKTVLKCVKNSGFSVKRCQKQCFLGQSRWGQCPCESGHSVKLVVKTV